MTSHMTRPHDHVTWPCRCCHHQAMIDVLLSHGWCLSTAPSPSLNQLKSTVAGSRILCSLPNMHTVDVTWLGRTRWNDCGSSSWRLRLYVLFYHYLHSTRQIESTQKVFNAATAHLSESSRTMDSETKCSLCLQMHLTPTPAGMTNAGVCGRTSLLGRVWEKRSHVWDPLITNINKLPPFSFPRNLRLQKLYLRGWVSG